MSGISSARGCDTELSDSNPLQWPTVTTVVRAGDDVFIKWTPTHRTLLEFEWSISDEVGDVFHFDSVLEMGLVRAKFARDAKNGVSIDADKSLLEDVQAYLTSVRVDIGVALMIRDGLVLEKDDGVLELTQAGIAVGHAEGGMA
jgi:hypothetical protein